MEAFLYFPSAVYRDEKPDWVEPALLASKKYYDSVEQQPETKNFCVHQTGGMTNDPNFENFKNYILEMSIEILKGQGYSVDLYDFFVRDLWGQSHKTYGHNWSHVHANSQITGFFFLEVPKNGSYPIIYDPRHLKSMSELNFSQTNEITNATNAIHFNNILPGTFLFFNSWLVHQFPLNNSSDPLKFIHFNVNAKERFF